MTLRISPFAEKHIEDAAALVTRRYKSLRSRFPLLPERYETPPKYCPACVILQNAFQASSPLSTGSFAAS